ncbi:MAG: hypothetical protein IKZ87_06075 [Actinomycetaceae bacterium]|nr:hypothetical protein [Actinomycetaceae bacterium]
MDFTKNFILLVFDTETTGLKSTDGNRVVELGVQVLLWKAGTGAKLFEVLDSSHWYFNPERPSEPGAARVHRLSENFLSTMPTAAERIPAISTWIDGVVARADAQHGVTSIWLVAHNAIFDVAFANGEMRCAGLQGTFPALLRASGVLCTKQFFRNAVPDAGKFSQNCFCGWAGVDTSARHNNQGEEVHGALVDCQLLAKALVEAHKILGTDSFAASCKGALLDTASLASTDSLSVPVFCESQRSEPDPETIRPEEITPEEAARQALKDKCAGAMSDFKSNKGAGDIATFEAALWKRGVRLRLNFADDYRRISGTSYTDGQQTLAGSAVGKEFSSKPLMELVGYDRLRHWQLVQHHLPLIERLRSLPLDSLVPLMSADKIPVLPLPDATTLAGFELHRHFRRAGAVFRAMADGEVQRAQVSEWLASLREHTATKPFADSVAVFLNGFSFAASLHERGSNVREHLERTKEKLDSGTALSAKEEIAWLHQGTMFLCEQSLPSLRKK